MDFEIFCVNVEIDGIFFLMVNEKVSSDKKIGQKVQFEINLNLANLALFIEFEYNQL